MVAARGRLRVNDAILRANLHLLFWLSLARFVTGWMGENNFARTPTAVYGVVLLMAAIASWILQRTIIAEQGHTAVLAMAQLGSAKRPAVLSAIRRPNTPRDCGGVSIDGGIGIVGKYLELLKEAVPNMTKVGILQENRQAPPRHLPFENRVHDHPPNHQIQGITSCPSRQKAVNLAAESRGATGSHWPPHRDRWYSIHFQKSKCVCTALPVKNIIGGTAPAPLDQGRTASCEGRSCRRGSSYFA
jgi:hypothetical protein